MIEQFNYHSDCHHVEELEPRTLMDCHCDLTTYLVLATKTP